MKNITMDKVAAFSGQYARYSFDYFIDSMVKCGYKNIELWCGEPHYFRPDYTSSGEAARHIRELKKKLDDRGLKVVLLTPVTLNYPYNPAAAGEAWRNRTIDAYKMAVEDALEFGAHALLANNGWGLRDEPVEKAWGRLVDTFQKVAAFAKNMGVSVSVEQLQPYETNLVRTSTELQRLLNEAGGDNLFACIDFGAMCVSNETVEDFYTKMPGKIHHLHFCDRNHEVPGDRDLPLADYLETLDRHGYDQWITLEINDPMYDEDPHNAYFRAARWMRKTIS